MVLVRYNIKGNFVLDYTISAKIFFLNGLLKESEDIYRDLLLNYNINYRSREVETKVN